MPIYAYRCTTCGHAKDVLQKISDPLLTVCPACGASTFVKQVTAAGFQLKGSGWYVTDFRGGDSSGKPAGDAGDGAAKTDAKDGAGKNDAGKNDAGKNAGKADAGKNDAGRTDAGRGGASGGAAGTGNAAGPAAPATGSSVAASPPPASK